VTVIHIDRLASLAVRPVRQMFRARDHKSAGEIASSQDLIEIDFVDGKVSGVGDQYGIGRSLQRTALTERPHRGAS
jgi:hypothetical protein